MIRYIYVAPEEINNPDGYPVHVMIEGKIHRCRSVIIEGTSTIHWNAEQPLETSEGRTPKVWLETPHAVVMKDPKRD